MSFGFYKPSQCILRVNSNGLSVNLMVCIALCFSELVRPARCYIHLHIYWKDSGCNLQFFSKIEIDVLISFIGYYLVSLKFHYVYRHNTIKCIMHCNISIYNNYCLNNLKLQNHAAVKMQNLPGLVSKQLLSSNGSRRAYNCKVRWEVVKHAV